MSNIVVLDSLSHRKLRVHAQPALQYGDNQRFVAVVVNEFPILSLHYPILFSKDADTGQFYCGAMLGFDAGENLFLDEHRAQRLYRPLNLQRGPFFTAGSDLAVDLEHPRVAPSGDQALFDEAGAPTVYLQSIMGLMRDLRPGLERSRIFIDTLLSLNLIEPMTIEARFDDGSNREVTGLYTVNRERLQELADAAVVDLFRRGYLQLVYLMLASLKHVPTLAQKKNDLFLPGGDSRASGLA
ncbi:MAG TPA: SapC family protein [Steroidobacteraceae bacterium]|nr:SapC family protein [Steroidobacteraceae bacterium]